MAPGVETTTVDPSKTSGMKARGFGLGGLATAVVVRVGGRLSRVVAGVVAYGLASRALGPSRFGNYVIVFAFIQLFLVFATFGMDRVLLRDLPQPERIPGQHRELVRAAVTARIVMAALVGGAAVALSVILGFSDQVIYAVLFFSPYILFTALSSSGLLGTILQVHGRSGSIVAANAASSVVVITGTILAALMRANLNIFLLAYTLSSLADVLVCLLLARGVFEVRWSWNNRLLRYLVRESYPLAIASGFVLVYGRIDIIILEKLTDPRQVALYGVAYKYFDVLSTVALTVMVVLAPVLSRAYTDLRRANSLFYSEVFTFMLAAALPLTFTFVVLRQWLLILLVGRQFLDAQIAVPGLMLAITFVFVSSVASHMTLLVHRQRWNVLMAIVASGLNIVLNLVLIPRFGYVASAWATAATEGFVLLFYVSVVGVLGKLAPSFRSVVLVVMSAAPFALVLVTKIPTYVSGAIGLLLYFTLLFAFGILRPARLRAILATRFATTTPTAGWEEDSMMHVAALGDTPSSPLPAIRPDDARQSRISTEVPGASNMPSSSWPPNNTRGSSPRSRPQRTLLLISGVLLVIALAAVTVIFVPAGIEIVALFVVAIAVNLVAIRAQWALMIFVLLLPLHNLLMSLLYQTTGDANFVKLLQPWKEVVLVIALLRAGLPALIAWRRTRRLNIGLLDVGVLAFIALGAISVAIPSSIVPLSGRAYTFRQLVTPLMVYFVGRLAPPNRKEIKVLVGFAAANIAVYGALAMVERAVLGNALPIDSGVGAYIHTFFKSSSYLPFGLGTTFYTGSPQWLPRTGSLSVNPLDFATLVMIFLPVVLAAASIRNATRKHLGFGLTAGVLLVTYCGAAGVVLAFSRANLLLFPIELALLLVLTGFGRSWVAILGILAGGAAGIVLFMQAAAYVISATGMAARVHRANQGLLSSQAYSTWDIAAPSLVLIGLMILVLSLVRLRTRVKERQGSTVPPVVGIALGMTLIAGVVFAINLNGLHVGLVTDVIPHSVVPQISSMSTSISSMDTPQPVSSPTDTPVGVTGVLKQAASDNNTSTQWHVQSYAVLVSALLHRPFGYGLGAAARLTGQSSTGLHIESAYVPVAFDLGVPGLVLYLLILAGAFVACLRVLRLRGDSLRRAVFLGMAVAWFFALADGLVRDISTSLFVLFPLWWMAGSAVAHARRSLVVASSGAEKDEEVVYRSAQPLRIAMDVQCLRTARTGVRTYVTRLLDEFEHGDMPHMVIPLAGPKGLPRTRRMYRIINQVQHLLWLHVWLPLRLLLGNFDVLFSPEYLTPIWCPIPRVVTYHDSAFLRRPQDYNRLWQLFFRRVTVPAIRRADAIVVPSRYTATEANRYAHFPTARMHVTYLGGPQPGSIVTADESVSNAVLSRLGLTPKRYLLHVGVLERRKNLTTLVNAFHDLRLRGLSDTFKLVLVGQPGPRPDLDDAPNIRATIDRLGLQDHVLLTGYLPDEDVQALYTHATAYVLPSWSEGFGLPVLEAFASGVPVVCSTAGALSEIAGDAALPFHPDDEEELVNCLIRLDNDTELSMRLVQAGKERARLFTWTETAVRTMQAFEAAVLYACLPDNAASDPELEEDCN